MSYFVIMLKTITMFMVLSKLYIVTLFLGVKYMYVSQRLSQSVRTFLVFIVSIKRTYTILLLPTVHNAVMLAVAANP